MKDVVQLSKGGALGPGVDPVDPPQADGNNTLSAPDFSDDKTGLPRYPDAVSGVASAYTYGPGGQQDVKGSSVVIVTGSSFDTAVAWYVKSLPAGWRSQTVGDLGALAQQLSVQNLGKMLGMGGSADDHTASAPAPPAGPQVKVSVFTPPQGTANDPGVMIVQKDQESVKILMKVNLR
ncbi:MAG TPA: hypothetical protein VGV09_20570 [Steroidobacteraceae bacterium]|nr:hypothetical protein [Steroidobacteraceae bacterium]